MPFICIIDPVKLLPAICDSICANLIAKTASSICGT